MPKKSKKLRISVYLTKDTLVKLDALNYNGRTRSYKINDLLNIAMLSKNSQTDEVLLNQLAKVIINSVYKKIDENNDFINDLINKQITEVEFQAKLLQALIKSVKLYLVANSKNAIISEETIKEHSSEFIENSLKKDIEKIKKGK